MALPAKSTLGSLGAALAALASKWALPGALLVGAGIAVVLLSGSPESHVAPSSVDSVADVARLHEPDYLEPPVPAPPIDEPIDWTEGLTPQPPRPPRAEFEPVIAEEPLESAPGAVPEVDGALPTEPASGSVSSTPKKVDEAVQGELRWLAAHQSPDGGWESDGWRNQCDGEPSPDGPSLEGAGNPQHNVGVTGLALLAFLGSGYTNRSEGPFGPVVGKGLKYLRNVQDAEGCFGARASPRHVYDHAVAALAMVEAYGMTGSSIYVGPAQKALDFSSLARNPYFAWGYGVKPGESDTSVTGWMMLALKSARLINAAEVKAGRRAPLSFDEDAFDGVKTWIEKMTDPDTGRVGYQSRGGASCRAPETAGRFPASSSEAMTAVGLLARIFMGERPATSDAIRKGAALCAARPPAWTPSEGNIDFSYWYFGTLAMKQVGGDGWRAWEAGMKTAIAAMQRQDGDPCHYKGSWDPIDVWGAEGGRVYATALMSLSCEFWSACCWTDESK